MGYEIDFLSVGNGEKSGDAIAVRYGTAGDVFCNRKMHVFAEKELTHPDLHFCC